MNDLKSRLRADLTTSMKARDELTTATLRMVLSAISQEETSGKSAHELTDEQALQVLTRENKKRKEAAQAFADAGRTEQAERERAEGAVIEAYLPAQLGDAELAELVRAGIAEAGATGMSQMGPAMKAVQAKVAGRAEGGRVAAEVRRQLSS
ncbi:MAG TPA: GatB/YqeY domain-containing protein [Mycobacteriales bacterium]|nr:GatB/YqeY domain-containing protein [Mycobacteriales bacterium]